MSKHDRLIAAIEAIYAAAADPSRWPSTLEFIANCFDDVGAILIYGRDDGSFGVIASPSLRQVSADYAQGWSDRDLRAIRARERGYFFKRDVITDRDLMTDDDMETHPFYVDFLRRHELRYFAAATVSPDPHIEVAVSVQRAMGRPEYSDEELEFLERLAPHIETSLRLSIHLMDAKAMNSGMGTAMARIGIGVFALDAMGRVVASNAASQALLGDGLNVVNDRLVLTNPAASEEAVNAIRNALDGNRILVAQETRPILVHRQSANRPLALYVLPIPAQNSASGFLARARAIVLLMNPTADGIPDPSLIRDVLGVTLGEARIAALVGSGLSPKDAAERLGIAEETARSVLKRVFSKVGVSRQSELAAMMARLVIK
ncbi:putative LuxR-family regulatory protein [Bradyrhizobiaceae bacterium SG-6C]|nr:putative LuxR-family regulatory protein [Bradyrhizobiaceae bacterium SG-6C]